MTPGSTGPAPPRLFGPMGQEDGRRLLLAESDRIDRQIGEVVAGLAEYQFHAPPPTGGWGIGQVLEHLCVAHDSYLVRMESILARPGLARAAPDARWRPSFWGGMLLKGLASPTHLPAPRIYQVGPTPRPLVLKEFLARQEKLREFLRRAAEVDWRRTGLVSPVSPLFRMNLGDGFMILVAHADRHRGQMERVRAALVSGGPGAP